MSRDSKRRRRITETPTVMLTSMTDMFTLILMFLLNFVDPSMSSDSGVQLPTASASEAASQTLTLTITPVDVRVAGRRVFALTSGHVPSSVERDGKLLVPLYDALAGARRSFVFEDVAADDEPLLRVECDKAVPYTVVADTLHTAGKAGFGRFQLVVIQGGE